MQECLHELEGQHPVAENGCKGTMKGQEMHRKAEVHKCCPLPMQERLQQLEGQMSVKERELQRLKAEAEAIDSDRARTEEEKKKMRAAFEEKVESVQRQLMQLQRQLKEGEAAKVIKAETEMVNSPDCRLKGRACVVQKDITVSSWEHQRAE